MSLRLKITKDCGLSEGKILITGSNGLVGTAITSTLLDRGVKPLLFDIVGSGDDFGDVLDFGCVKDAVNRCIGIIHLAAVTRVAVGEKEPDHCWTTNVHGLQNVLRVITNSEKKPWLIFASSREVYGSAERLPVTEKFPLRPVNIYGRSKLEGERLVDSARRTGLRACTVRLSNVYGSTEDYSDRVVPAFAKAAAFGKELRVDGAEQMFDFTHVDDVANGIIKLAELMDKCIAAPSPIHLVSGVPTTLNELAHLAIRLAQSSATIRYTSPRDFDVGRFFGSASRAKEILDWEPSVAIENGLYKLINDFRSLSDADFVHV